jgi:hypothetical protein
MNFKVLKFLGSQAHRLTLPGSHASNPGGPIPPSKPQIQNTYEKMWLFETKLLKLDVW